MSEKVGADSVRRKHLAGIKYAPIEIETGLEAFEAAIRNTLAGRFARFDGSIDEATADGDVIRSRTFHHALITEVGFPALDAASKNVGQLSIKLAPEYTRTQKASGALKAPAQTKQQLFQVCNFRLEVQGLDATRVSKVDAFTVKQAVRPDSIGDTRDYQREPTALEVPNLKVTLSGSSVESFASWHEDFVVRGNNGSDKEKTGSIVFLSPNQSEELMRIDLGGVGIFAMRPSRDPDRIAAWEVELYAETIRIR